jgi:hypothetical protein
VMLLSKAPGPKKLQSCRGRIPFFPAIGARSCSQLSLYWP